MWGDLLDRVHHPRDEVTVALVGKYIDLPDAYLSVSEALRAGGVRAPRARARSAGCLGHLRDAGRARRPRSPASTASSVPGGFGIRGIEGKVGAAAPRPRARHPDPRPVPRTAVHGDRGGPAPGRASTAPTRRSSTPTTPDPVIATMADQVDIVAGKADLGGTMRLGAYPATLDARLGRRRGVRHHGGVRAAPAPLRGEQRLPRPARGRRAGHLRHVAGRAAGRVRRAARATCTRSSPATQAHPELKSRPTRAHPLFRGLVEAALAYNAAERLPVEIPDEPPPSSWPRPHPTNAGRTPVRAATVVRSR